MPRMLKAFLAMVLAFLIGPACGESVGGGDSGSGGPSGGGTGGEYGSPQAAYRTSGHVLTRDDRPIEKITVALHVSGRDSSGPGELVASAETASDGSFEATGSGWPWCVECEAATYTGWPWCPETPGCEATIVAIDIDGPAGGGEFASQTESVVLEQTGQRSGWFFGTWEAGGVVIRLDRVPASDAGMGEDDAGVDEDDGGA